ncbi:hypothetical protein B0H16DRAFT_1501918 [Mycena metata]|uniref:Protein kinase domain-containing protein n=1 Tax=Mycena metata TaxID=1033252 RepID=A0AAD7KAT0_9AGAR|nr:hypothetical protein B0H16DRAFT_1501918 [Mycena metata]
MCAPQRWQPTYLSQNVDPVRIGERLASTKFHVDEGWCLYAVSRKVKGTPRYYAPELFQSNGKKHFASDVYAFACVCYEILTGHVPFHTERKRNICHASSYRGKAPCPTGVVRGDHSAR